MRFAALSLVSELDPVRVEAQRLKLGAKILVTDDEVLSPFGVNQVPSTVFIDSRGVIVAAVSGPKGKKFLERRLKELVR